MNIHRGYIRAGILPIHNVFQHVGKKEHTFWIGNTAYNIKMKSLRYKVFKTKGIMCVNCGLIATYFAIERSFKSTGRYHLNLYGRLDNNEEVLFTKDHIIPLSKNGPDTLDNLQTMCVNCNVKKGNSYE